MLSTTSSLLCFCLSWSWSRTGLSPGHWRLSFWCINSGQWAGKKDMHACVWFETDLENRRNVFFSFIELCLAVMIRNTLIWTCSEARCFSAYSSVILLRFKLKFWFEFWKTRTMLNKKVDLVQIIWLPGPQVLPLVQWLVGTVMWCGCCALRCLLWQARLAVNSVTAGDYSRPLRISTFINELDSGFRLLNLKNDSLRKRYDGLKYDVKKIEEVVYDLSIRGLNKEATVGAGGEKWRMLVEQHHRLPQMVANLGST